jgi:thymidine kinase
MRHQLEGRIEMITGCMFAGKTEEIMRRIRRAELADKEIEIFTQKKDDRYGEYQIGSHSGREREAIPVKNAEEILREVSDSTQVVAIDEANFFSNSLVDVVQEMANNGKRVIISGIDQNFRGEPFSPVPEIMAVSEEVQKLTAICSKCGDVATRNQRINKEGLPAKSSEDEILVSDDSRYEARCRRCHELR